MPFTVATWNVNSLRQRLSQVLDWLRREQPDVLAIQETKLSDHEFPVMDFADIGYQPLINGQKSYNGVALLSRHRMTRPVTELPGDPDDLQRRVLGAACGPLYLLDLYVPNGAEVGSDKYRYKLAWLERLQDFTAGLLEQEENLVLLGDFNIAPEPRDVHDPAQWEGRVLFSEPERQAFRDLLATGLCDTFRLFEQEEQSFSWWDYRMAAFRRNLGLRIDHILASPELCKHCRASTIDKTPRGWERPSDHAPVVACFDVAPNLASPGN